MSTYMTPAQITTNVITPGEVERAASIYRDALEDGRLPLKAVMKELDLTKPTASRRIRAARDLGLIPEKGEQA